jgi:hypothetical protein
MEILTTVDIAGQTLTVNDSWDIGNGIIIRIKEIFSVEDQIYVSLVTENQPMMSVKISLDSEEKITPNRYINNAELWVKKNSKLFETI